jgi:hypothetical protein
LSGVAFAETTKEANMDDGETLNAILKEEIDNDEFVIAMAEQLMSSSDEEDERQWGGSRKGREQNKDRDFLAAYNQVMKDYFNGRDSEYNEADFER